VTARTAWRAAAGGVGLGLSAGWNLANVGAIADDTARDYGVSLTLVGLFTTALLVMHAAMQLPAGRLTDRFGARRVGLAGVLLVAACNAVAAIEASVPLTIVARVAMGVGTAICFVTGSDYVRSLGGGPLAQGIFGSAGVGSGGLALLVVPQLEPSLGWRSAYASAGTVAVLGLVVLALGPADPPRARAAAGPAGALRGDGRLWRLAILHTASFGLSVLLGNWVTTLLEHEGGLSTGAAGAVGSLTLLLGFATRLLGGWAVRARPAWGPPLVAGSFVAGAAGTLALLPARPLGLALAASAVVGLAAGVPFAYVFSAAARIRPDAPAAAIGLVNMLAAAVILAGNPLLGLAFSTGEGGRIGFAAIALLWLAAVAAVRR
jgi:predicted MFS family arabinose efflux permease